MANKIRTFNLNGILKQSGFGTPNHLAPRGSEFTDIDTTNIYTNEYGLTGWKLINFTGTSGTNTYVTGGTYNSITDIITFTNNSGGAFNVSITGLTDTYITGGTYNSNTDTISLNRNDATTVDITGLTDTYVTGGTYNSITDIISFTNNSGGAFNVSITGLTDTYVTGGTYNSITDIISLNINDATTVDITGLTDTYVTGGTYNSNTDIISFTNNSGGAFNISGDTQYFDTSMDFEQDDTVTTILFKDVTTSDVLSAEAINSIEAVQNGTDIRIQKSGGSVILIDALNIAATYIDGVLVSTILTTALAELNALFFNAGSIGNAPVITSSSTLNLTYTFTLNHVLTGTDIVAINWDIYTTGTVPAGQLATPEGDHRRVIGGSALPVGSYTFYVTAINYYGSVTQTITLIVAVPPFSNTKSWNPQLSSAAYFRDDVVVGQENNNSFYRASGPTGTAWTVFGWAKTTKTSGWTANNPRPLINFGGDFTGTDGAVRIYYKRYNSYFHTINLRYGDNTNYVNGNHNFLMTTGDWFSWAIVYDGTATTSSSPFTIYIDGVSISPTWTLGGGGYSGSIEFISGNNNTKLHIAKIFDVVWSNMSMAFIDDIGIFDSDQSANISAFHNSGTPIDLNFGYSPFSYYRFGDVPTDMTGYPTLTNVGATGNNLKALGVGTVGDYVNNTPP